MEFAYCALLERTDGMPKPNDGACGYSHEEDCNEKDMMVIIEKQISGS